ncbi:hypothetical protein KFK09_007153 [Dendrobium nobile]|uniref:Uncharacterized protein n=1 Tax=Dendrobium nobile TaxID=94219 RepID=A0A8T3BUD5_DENNO|nr:hypothetical protein KFK09_007153 [Dendrobium nobile]
MANFGNRNNMEEYIQILNHLFLIIYVLIFGKLICPPFYNQLIIACGCLFRKIILHLTD